MERHRNADLLTRGPARVAYGVVEGEFVEVGGRANELTLEAALATSARRTEEHRLRGVHHGRVDVVDVECRDASIGLLPAAAAI